MEIKDYIVIYYTESKYFKFKRKHVLELNKSELCDFLLEILDNDEIVDFYTYGLINDKEGDENE